MGQLIYLKLMQKLWIKNPVFKFVLKINFLKKNIDLLRYFIILYICINKRMGFVPLHNHSDYSLLDGASQVPKIVERASNLGMKSIALTDHGVMYGVLELVKNCKKFGIKPIIGNEMYIINGSIEQYFS